MDANGAERTVDQLCLASAAISGDAPVMATLRTQMCRIRKRVPAEYGQVVAVRGAQRYRFVRA